MKKYRVGILGATGMVGQRFIQLLADHPHLKSPLLPLRIDRKARRMAKRARGASTVKCLPPVRSMPVQPPAPPLDCDLVFSSLPGDIARETEGSFAAAGYPVISNSSAYRMDEDVPLLIPEVNHPAPRPARTTTTATTFVRWLHRHQPELLDDHAGPRARAVARGVWHLSSRWRRRCKRFQAQGIRALLHSTFSTTCCRTSAAKKRRSKRRRRRFSGRFVDDRIEPAPMAVSAQCHRVNVADGHMAAVRVKFRAQTELARVA